MTYIKDLFGKVEKFNKTQLVYAILNYVKYHNLEGNLSTEHKKLYILCKQFQLAHLKVKELIDMYCYITDYEQISGSEYNKYIEEYIQDNLKIVGR